MQCVFEDMHQHRKLGWPRGRASLRPRPCAGWPRERPVVVQSVFVRGEGGGTSEAELAVYLDELRKLLAAGAKISEAQICSAPELGPAHPCAQVPLATLMQIAAGLYSADAGEMRLLGRDARRRGIRVFLRLVLVHGCLQ